MTDDIPVIFLNKAEIDFIKANIAANIEPWKSAFDGTSSKSMISLANSALSVPLQSVVDGGTVHPITHDPHDYYSQSVYQSPDGDRTDQLIVQNLQFALRKVALGYMFTGEARYANKVKDFIYQWCLNPATKVNPRYPPYNPEWANDSKIFLPRANKAIVLGAAAIWNYPDFQQYKASFKSWLIQMIDATTWDTNGYSWGTQRDLFLIMAGALLYHDADTKTKGLSIINTVINRFKEVCFNSFTSEGTTYAAKIDTNGSITHQRNRATGNPLNYSAYEIFGLTAIAEVAYHYGTDLYHYTQNGRSLEKALDFHVPYIINPSLWPYRQNGSANNIGIYEVAYTRYNEKPLYKDIITHFGRPMEEYNIMGTTTLTHAGIGGIDGGGGSGGDGGGSGTDVTSWLDETTCLTPTLCIPNKHMVIGAGAVGLFLIMIMKK